MKVEQFIKWLETQDQNLEVCVVECEVQTESGAFGEEDILYTDTVCFDYPESQSSKTKNCLILGVQ